MILFACSRLLSSNSSRETASEFDGDRETDIISLDLFERAPKVFLIIGDIREELPNEYRFRSNKLFDTLFFVVLIEDLGLILISKSPVPTMVGLPITSLDDGDCKSSLRSIDEMTKDIS